MLNQANSINDELLEVLDKNNIKTQNDLNKILKIYNSNNKLIEILKKRNIKTQNKLYKVLEIYDLFELSDLTFDSFKELLNESISSYVNWNEKIDFIRERFLNNISKDQFSVDLEIKLEKYLTEKYDNFNILNRNENKSKFDKQYGYKTKSSIRQFLKKFDQHKFTDSSIKIEYEKEKFFIENFCNIYNISFDWFFNVMYKSRNELILLNDVDIRPKTINTKIKLEVTQMEKLLSILNNSSETINNKIISLIDKKTFNNSLDFYISLLFNAFEKTNRREKALNNTLLNLIEYIEIINKNHIFKNEINLIKAKLLSNLEKDKEVIDFLNSEYEINEDTTEEVRNILAASYKRYGIEITEYKYLEKSLTLYKESFKLEKDYYSLINILYILKILDHKDFDKYKLFWKDIQKEDNWWYIISNLEFLMLSDNTEELEKELNNLPKIEDISKFNISSTLRQLEKFKLVNNNNTSNFKALDILCNKLQEIEKNPDIGKNVFV